MTWKSRFSGMLSMYLFGVTTEEMNQIQTNPRLPEEPTREDLLPFSTILTRRARQRKKFLRYPERYLSPIILAEYRLKWGRMMAKPMTRFRDYARVGRNAFLIQDLEKPNEPTSLPRDGQDFRPQADENAA